jgi:hypothetical protein
VTLKGEKGVVAIHSVAVIADADKLAASRFDLDADAIGACVEGVFKEFLDDRGGAVYDFTGGNLVGHLVRKNMNAPHGESVTGIRGQRSGMRKFEMEEGLKSELAVSTFAHCSLRSMCLRCGFLLHLLQTHQSAIAIGALQGHEIEHRKTDVREHEFR